MADAPNASKSSESLFADEHSPLSPPPPRSWWKAAVLVVVVGAVAIILLMKGGSAEKPRPRGAASAFPPDTVLARVNDEPITVADLETTLGDLPDVYRSEYEQAKEELLDELILQRLLLQEARRKNIPETDAYRQALAEHAAHPGHEEHVLIDVLLRTEVLGKVRITDEDLRTFYEEVKDQVGGRTFDEVKDLLRPSLEQQRQYEAVETYLADLREKATIERNEEWLAAQRAASGENPLDQALRSGKPVLADFGQGTCIPCKMMAPILDRLAQELAGRVHVLVLDTRDYPRLARHHGIRVIPTQIFFDATGVERDRHEGFMGREALLRKMRELGMLPEEAAAR